MLEELSLDAWGNRRNPETWEPYTTTPEFSFDRGFIGHEHLDLFALINMNGRVYDPVIGRFLSPDIVMQTSGSLQGLNKYSYANNNPLVFTDPDGNFPWLIVGIGTAIGGFQGYLQGKSMGATGGDMFRYIATGAVHGGISSAFGAWSAGGAGNSLFNINAKGTIPGALIGSVEGGLAGAFSGGISSAALGGNFWEGAKWGAIYGGTSGGIVGGYSGFRTANESGLNIWWGSEIGDNRNKWSYFNWDKWDVYRFKFSQIGPYDIEKACFSMTLADIGGDPQKNSQYYLQKVKDFYLSEFGIDRSSLRSDHLEHFFNYIKEFDGEYIGRVYGFIESVPSSDFGVLGYTANWKGAGHAMPLYKIKVLPNDNIFKLYFRNQGNQGSTFQVTSADYHTYGFQFWRITIK